MYFISILIINKQKQRFFHKHDNQIEVYIEENQTIYKQVDTQRVKWSALYQN
jgi:hypothetical protein